MNQNQQKFLKQAMQELGLKREEFAKRIGVSWDTFRRWLMSPESLGAREMPPAAWSLVREVLQHEKLKIEHQKLKTKINKAACSVLNEHLD